MSRSELEAALLQDPFNTTLRLAYADLPLQAGEATAARAQYQLAGKGDDGAALLVGEART